MLCLRYALLLVVISSACLLHAEPLRPAVDRAKYILHLKVAAIEEPTNVVEKDGDNLTYGPEYAVCDVEDILLGMVASDRNGRVRVACVSRKNTRDVEGEVRYEKGDEFTLVADAAELSPRKGMIFSDARHFTGKPTKALRATIYERVEAAKSLAAALEELVPGASAEAEAAVAEFGKQSRDDFSDLSPEADLLLDLLATADYMPDAGDLARPAIDDATRIVQARMALRALCGLSREDAETAVALFDCSGHGVYGLLKPAKIADETALATLRKLADKDEFHALANHLLRYDVEHRALGWMCRLAPETGPTPELAQWALIEAVEGGWTNFAEVDTRLAPERSAGLPYDTASQRAVANAIDKRANRLAAWLVMRQGAALKASDKVTASASVVDGHTKKAGELYGTNEMLQVYAYALAMQGAEAQHVADARPLIEKKRKGELDLTDISAVDIELRRKNILPDAVRRAVKTQRR